MTIRILAALGLCFALFIIGIRGPSWMARADVAAGYSARLICACHYVEGRGWQGCRADLADESFLELVMLAKDDERRKVTASIPLIASRSATFEPGIGCTMDR
jgi:hypothetical protein